ncbi:PP2C family protein-serine/threonine phosphatase [Paracoccus aminophilus]|uniref:Serine/threonine phosphatase n=1 Tax=Paracoccus aminophilus JCM 7686 TaxID=1367847 RepID=S5Y7I0_PARAH|nr:protein phosphatase 2C domain-containing protein [Paracoccus aminophilus]AGT11470.1 serine/threonine phosphatase [Paracoccus aminophilus JCM 7686]
MTEEEAGFLFETGAASDRGVVREHNEDSLGAFPEAGVWAVADGMGGHQAGDLASRTIVEELASLGLPVSAMDLRARVLERIERANLRILALARERQLATVGSTLAALLIHGQEFACTWAGDSRVYLLRKGILHRLTTDHSEVAQLIARGGLTEEEARSYPNRNVITKAIGIQMNPRPETVTGVVEGGDLFLLCSDGLTEHNSDEDLRQAMLTAEPAQLIAARLIEQTLMRGARDNVSVLIVRCILSETEDMAEP